MPIPLRISVFVLGDRRVGKSTLLKKTLGLMKNVQLPPPSSLRLFGISFSRDQRDHEINFYDVPTEFDFEELCGRIQSDYFVFCIVFDCSEPSTLDFAEYLLNKIAALDFQESIHVVLLGGKSDLPSKISKRKIENVIEKFAASHFNFSSFDEHDLHRKAFRVFDSLF